MPCKFCDKEGAGPYLHVSKVGRLCIACSLELYQDLTKMLRTVLGLNDSMPKEG